MHSTEEGIVISVNDEQLMNAYHFINVTDKGIFICSNDEQQANE